MPAINMDSPTNYGMVVPSASAAPPAVSSAKPAAPASVAALPAQSSGVSSSTEQLPVPPSESMARRQGDEEAPADLSPNEPAVELGSLTELMHDDRAKANFIRDVTERDYDSRIEPLDALDAKGLELNDKLGAALRYLKEQEAVNTGGSAQQAEDHFKFSLLLENQDVELLVDEAEGQAALKAMLRLDSMSAVAVIANGVMLGMTVDGSMDSESTLAFVMENGFLLFFVVEWLVRLHYHPRGICGMLLNRWTSFDAFVIAVSAFDSLMTLAGTESGTSMLSILRIVRLLRLIRLVKLLKLLKSLWLLVSGMMTSMEIVLWAIFLLLIVCYTMGILMYSVYGQHTDNHHDNDIQMLWGSILKSILSLLQLTTYDEGMAFWPLFEDYPHMGLMVFFFSSVCGIGIMNLIVGMLLTAALEITDHDERYESQTIRINRHIAVRSLHSVLSFKAAERAATTQTDPHMISQHLVLQCMDPQHKDNWVDTAIAESWKTEADGASDAPPSLGTSKIFVPQLFEDADISPENVTTAIREMQTVIGEDAKVTVDDLITGCMWLKGHQHQINVQTTTAALLSLHGRLCFLNGMLREVSWSLGDMNACSLTILSKYHAHPDPDNGEIVASEADAKQFAKEAKEEAIMMLVEADPKDLDEDQDARNSADRDRKSQDAERGILKAQQEKTDVHLKWVKFDIFFSVFVFLNAVAIGFSVEVDVARTPDLPGFDQEALLWFAIENFFCIVFVSEMVLRACIYYQLEVVGDPEGVYWIICPANLKYDTITLCKIAMHFPAMVFSDTMSFFDTMLVAMSLVDNVVLRWAGQSMSWMMAIRMFRVLRMIRVLRLLHLIPELYCLTEGFISTIPLLFWALVFQFGICYVQSIVIVELIAKDASFGAHTAWWSRWSSMKKTVLTLTQISTFDSWCLRIDEVSEDVWWVRFLLLLHIAVTALSMLNLVKGIMVQAAITMQAQLHATDFSRNMIKARLSLQQTRDAIVKEAAKLRAQNHAAEKLRAQNLAAEKLIYHHTSSNWSIEEPEGTEGPIPRKFSSELGLATLPTLTEAGESPSASPRTPAVSPRTPRLEPSPGLVEPELPAGSTSITCQQLEGLLQNGRLVKQLKRIHVEMPHALMVFQKLDVLHLGHVDIDDFIGGLLRKMKPVDGIDVAHTKFCFRTLIFQTVHLRAKASKLHELLTEVVQSLQGVRIIQEVTEMSDKYLHAEDLFMHTIDAKVEALRSKLDKMQVQTRNCKAHLKARKRMLTKEAGLAPLFVVKEEHDARLDWVRAISANEATGLSWEPSILSSAPGVFE